MRKAPNKYSFQHSKIKNLHSEYLPNILSHQNNGSHFNSDNHLLFSITVNGKQGIRHTFATFCTQVFSDIIMDPHVFF